MLQHLTRRILLGILLRRSLGSRRELSPATTRHQLRFNRECLLMFRPRLLHQQINRLRPSLSLQPLLLVDGETVTTDVTGATVTAEVLAETKGPKIRIIKYKNKTGYRKRQGHRQKYTQVRVTGIES